MKTCYNCGNNASPSTKGGKKNVRKLHSEAFHHYHALAHFGFCVKRRRWLEDHRVDCANWTNPCHFDANRVHVHLPHRVAKVVAHAHDHRYSLALGLMTAVMALGVALTAYINGYS